MRAFIAVAALASGRCLDQAPKKAASPTTLLLQNALRHNNGLAASRGQGQAENSVHLSGAKTISLAEAGTRRTKVEDPSKGLGAIFIQPEDVVFTDTQLRNPSSGGHMLTDYELKPINNVACLEAKQSNPAVNCTSQSEFTATYWKGSGQLNAGNYPSWKEPVCGNDGKSFLCDPESLLTVAERKELMATMKEQLEKQLVTCGPQLQHDAVDKWHYQPFYLGVAIAKEWPLEEADSPSLQQFGRILAGRWNMALPWDGTPAFYSRCPSEAILIILPKYNQAFLSSSSCMFLCSEKGGPEVTTATLGMLNSDGLLAGAKAGVVEVYNALKQTSPMHNKGWEPSENTSGTWGGMPYGSKEYFEGSSSGKSWSTASDWVWNLTMRVLFGIAVMALAGSSALALFVCFKAPGMNKELNKSVV